MALMVQNPATRVVPLLYSQIWCSLSGWSYRRVTIVVLLLVKTPKQWPSESRYLVPGSKILESLTPPSLFVASACTFIEVYTTRGTAKIPMAAAEVPVSSCDGKYSFDRLNFRIDHETHRGSGFPCSATCWTKTCPERSIYVSTSSTEPPLAR